MLDELAEIGMELARDLRRQAAEADPNASDLGLKFARVARAVRQTLALQVRFEDGQALQAREAQAREAAQAAKAAGERRAHARARRYEASDIAERLFEAEHPDEDSEAFEIELAEWLQAQDGEAFADAPMGEIVLAICRDLELSPDWSRWPNEDWALEAAAAETVADPPSPAAQARRDCGTSVLAPVPTATPPPGAAWMS